ncbi:hypothetical protein F3Y22_tig00111303pilonHSYRG00038 [Hibiscus syriacus]|uniref:Uncharacterized protein n=1 Tax=Hibiscus syriacus TaxID=106335 RepID=A0A6A2YR86_HIBSY|nr:hypothetical protein F3Y22_tig00111303pilonHSYRG00038 [Hibiscus syriacus]
MIWNRIRLRSTAKAATTEYLRRHYRHGTGDNLCTSALVNDFKAPVSQSYGSVHLLNNFRNSIQATVRFCTLTVSKDGVSQSHSKTPEGATVANKKPIDFTKLDINLLPTVMIVGHPNVGKSALFNRLIRRREALVYNTPDDHVTRDIREGLAKLGDLRFKVLDSAGLETEASSGSILNRTAAMTANVLARTQFAIFLLMSEDITLHHINFFNIFNHGVGCKSFQEVGRWLRKHAPGVNPIVAMNKSESLHNDTNSFAEAATEALKLGFGEPIAISAETGLGMTMLYESLRPMLESYMNKVLDAKYPTVRIQTVLLVGDPSLADKFHISPFSKKVNCWIPPPPDVFKFNVDGAVRGDGLQGGIGGILKDSKCYTLATFSTAVGPGPPILAELKAIKEGIDGFYSSVWAKKGKLIIETDCKNAVEWISKPHSTPTFFSALVDDIGASISDKDIFLRLIPRSCNMEANKLAKEGIG